MDNFSKTTFINATERVGKLRPVNRQFEIKGIEFKTQLQIIQIGIYCIQLKKKVNNEITKIGELHTNQ